MILPSQENDAISLLTHAEVFLVRRDVSMTGDSHLTFKLFNIGLRFPSVIFLSISQGLLHVFELVHPSFRIPFPHFSQCLVFSFSFFDVLAVNDVHLGLGTLLALGGQRKFHFL